VCKRDHKLSEIRCFMHIGDRDRKKSSSTAFMLRKKKVRHPHFPFWLPIFKENFLHPHYANSTGKAIMQVSCNTAQTLNSCTALIMTICTNGSSFQNGRFFVLFTGLLALRAPRSHHLRSEISYSSSSAISSRIT